MKIKVNRIMKLIMNKKLIQKTKQAKRIVKNTLKSQLINFLINIIIVYDISQQKIIPKKMYI